MWGGQSCQAILPAAGWTRRKAGPRPGKAAYRTSGAVKTSAVLNPRSHALALGGTPAIIIFFAVRQKREHRPHPPIIFQLHSRKLRRGPRRDWTESGPATGRAQMRVT